ncbi:death domain-containing ATP nucleosidase-like [Dysidea avara]|uniref:death domain-containing ATP nucleosidase-like n=1 Tax=Dysidea avara TaxID=196820 RepID=UPI00332AB5C7
MMNLQRRVISDTQAIIVVVNSIEFMATMCYLKPRNGLEHVLKTERGTKVGPDLLTHPLWFGDFGKCPVAVIRVKAGHGHHAVSHADKDTFPKVKLIVGVGVAAGFRENGVKLGDVLVSNRIHDCDQYKKKDGKDIPRGNIKNACSLMLQRLQEPFQWMYPCTQDKQRYCEIKSGLILSKPVLMDDKEERKRLLQYFGEEAKGYEMEGFGIMQSSIDCIIVKGVCDYAGEKTDDWQPTAALAANDYLQHHFRQDLSVLLEKKQDQSSRTVYVLVAIIVALVGIIIVLLLKGITTATQG